MKRFISIFLVIVIICPNFFSQKVFANENFPSKENLEIISDDFDNIIYTYDEKGKSYKVHENMNKELSQVHTEIYQKDDNSQYILIEKYDTTIVLKKDSYFEITKVQNGKRTIEKLELGIQHLDFKNLNAQQSDTAIVQASGYWELIDVHDGSTAFYNFTYGIVTSIISSIVTAGLGSVAAGTISYIVGYIVGSAVPIIYYNRMVFYYREPDYVSQVQVSTTFYYDSDHDYYVDAVTANYYGMFPW